MNSFSHFSEGNHRDETCMSKKLRNYVSVRSTYGLWLDLKKNYAQKWDLQGYSRIKTNIVTPKNVAARFGCVRTRRAPCTEAHINIITKGASCDWPALSNAKTIRDYANVCVRRRTAGATSRSTMFVLVTILAYYTMVIIKIYQNYITYVINNKFMKKYITNWFINIRLHLRCSIAM